MVSRLPADLRPQRAAIIRAIRDHFHGAGFLETDTPSLVRSPGMEPHIRPVKVEGRAAYLPTSPEFAMKRLLAEGFDRVFQVCRAYRLEPKSQTHNPEFTMLEWYRAGAGYEHIMDDVEGLFDRICRELHGGTRFMHPRIGLQNLERPWLRLSIEECFRRFAGKDLVSMLPPSGADAKAKEDFNDAFFRVFLNDIEPALAKLGRPVIVYDYPESQAALANLYTDARGLRWAKRFEVYAGGLELGNAFDELVDAREQRHRFEADMALRAQIYGADFPASPMDEEFLAALERMPPAGGIAMGVDRIVMYFTGAENISDVLWLPSHWPQ